MSSCHIEAPIYFFNVFGSKFYLFSIFKYLFGCVRLQHEGSSIFIVVFEFLVVACGILAL